MRKLLRANKGGVARDVRAHVRRSDGVRWRGREIDQGRSRHLELRDASNRRMRSEVV